MTTIIVGTTALKHHGVHLREPLDVDVWMQEGHTYLGTRMADTHWLPKEILDLVPTDIKGYATPDAVYTIKCSHANWDIKWEKTISDILVLKQKYSCRSLDNLYEALYKYWKGVHNDKSHLSLAKPKGEFFDDFVTYKYDHDYLHTLAAYDEKPLYTRCLKDGQDVFLDRDKFEALSFEDKVKLFREEMYVITLERYLIPSGFKMSLPEAWAKGRKKVITSLMKNWAAKFIILNIEQFLRVKDTHWLDNFLNKHGEEFPNMGDVNKDEVVKLKEEIMKVAIGLGLIKTYESLDDTIADIMSEGTTYGEPKKAFLAFLENEMGFVHLQQDGGGEGGSEYCYVIFTLKGKNYRASYSYYSYDGHDYDNFWDWKEVKPVTKTVTVYE